MRGDKGAFDPRNERGSPRTNGKLPQSAVILAGLEALDLSTEQLREAQVFGDGLIRDVADWHHREERRSEGVYCPNIERKVRHLTNRYNLSPLRARVVASLMGGGQ